MDRQKKHRKELSRKTGSGVGCGNSRQVRDGSGSSSKKTEAEVLHHHWIAMLWQGPGSAEVLHLYVFKARITVANLPLLLKSRN